MPSLIDFAAASEQRHATLQDVFAALERMLEAGSHVRMRSSHDHGGLTVSFTLRDTPLFHTFLLQAAAEADARQSRAPVAPQETPVRPREITPAAS